MSRERSNAPCPLCADRGYETPDCELCHGSGERPAVPAATVHGPVCGRATRYTGPRTQHLAADGTCDRCGRPIGGEGCGRWAFLSDAADDLDCLLLSEERLAAERDALRGKLDATIATYEREREECDRRGADLSVVLAHLKALESFQWAAVPVLEQAADIDSGALAQTAAGLRHPYLAVDARSALARRATKED